MHAMANGAVFLVNFCASHKVFISRGNRAFCRCFAGNPGFQRAGCQPLFKRKRRRSRCHGGITEPDVANPDQRKDEKPNDNSQDKYQPESFHNEIVDRTSKISRMHARSAGHSSASPSNCATRINFFSNSVFYLVLAWCKCNQVKQAETR